MNSHPGDKATFYFFIFKIAKTASNEVFPSFFPLHVGKKRKKYWLNRKGIALVKPCQTKSYSFCQLTFNSFVYKTENHWKHIYITWNRVITFKKNNLKAYFEKINKYELSIKNMGMKKFIVINMNPNKKYKIFQNC